MFRITVRNLVKDVLSFTKVKLLYTRITLSRITIVFFWAALINFIVGVVFQSISLNDHVVADHVTSALLSKANLTTSVGLPLLVNDDQILICTGIPGMSGTSCDFILPLGNSEDRTNIVIRSEVFERDIEELDSRSFGFLCPSLVKRIGELEQVETQDGEVTGVRRTGLLVSLPCITSFVWLAEMLRDAKREDLVTLTFQIWLLILALITILNESLPHLFTVLIGHLLLTGWAGFRIHESYRLAGIYYDGIVDGPCQGFDPMGRWWEDRFHHALPIVIVNCIFVVIMAGLAFKLFHVYAKQTFSRVGAAPKIHRLYKRVLMLSVSVQLTGFFVLASAGIWIDKIAYGPLRQYVSQFGIHLGGFIVLALLVIPWLVLGWMTIRREGRRSFLVFMGMSTIMLGITIGTFASPIHQFVFKRWAFFVTLSITSFLLIFVTVALSIWCRVGYGQGLKEYWSVTDALEGDDFTPVLFPVNGEKKVSFASDYDDEKKDLDLSFDIERRTSFVLPTMRKSAIFLPRPSVFLVPTPAQTPDSRPFSSVFDKGNTKIVSPTPALLKEGQSNTIRDHFESIKGRRSIKPSNERVSQIGSFPRRESNVSVASSSGSVKFASVVPPTPTRSPTAPSPSVRRPTPALHRMASGTKPPTSSPLKAGLRINTNIGLPPRPVPSSRTPSPDQNSKAGFF